MIDFLKNTQEAINYLIEKEGISVSEIAEIADVSRQTVHNWLKGKSVISRKAYHKLKKAFPDLWLEEYQTFQQIKSNKDIVDSLLRIKAEVDNLLQAIQKKEK